MRLEIRKISKVLKKIITEVIGEFITLLDKKEQD
jgi:hypothetical protein